MLNNLFMKNRAVYEIMCENIVTARQATDVNIVLRMCTARYITRLQTLRIMLFFHCNNGYANAPQRYVTRTLRVVYYVQRSGEHWI